MTIYKPSTYEEEYRLRALSRDINQLTGRTRPELTEFAIDRIVAAVDPKPDDVVVDIGCGNGLLLQKAAARGAPGHHGRLIGILPSEEEAGSGITENTHQPNPDAIAIFKLFNLRKV